MSGIAELIVDENSAIGAGTRIKLQKAELASFSAMKDTLTDCTRFNPASYKLGYIDTESEVIELMDDSDWITCVEEAQAACPSHPLIGVIIVGKDEKWDRESLTNSVLTRSWFMTPIPKANVEVTKSETNSLKTILLNQEQPNLSVSCQKEIPGHSDTQLESPKPAPTHVQEPKPETPRTITPVISEPTNTPLSEQPAQPTPATKPTVQPPSEPVLAKVPSSQHPKDHNYRFSYTESELEAVRKVPLPLFTQIERILAQKYEDGLVQGERAFKVFLEQQTKKKTIEHQKQVAALHQTIESLKKELAAAQSQIQQPNGLFAGAALPVSGTPVLDVADTSNMRKMSTASAHQEGQGQKDKYVHLQVSCDGCGAFPLPGIRYKALEKQDHDLCESCFLAEKDTKKAYLALRETEPNKFHALVQHARSSEQPNYKQDNNSFQRLHKWSDTEYKFKDLAFE